MRKKFMFLLVVLFSLIGFAFNIIEVEPIVIVYNDSFGKFELADEDVAKTIVSSNPLVSFYEVQVDREGLPSLKENSEFYRLIFIKYTDGRAVPVIIDSSGMVIKDKGALFRIYIALSKWDISPDTVQRYYNFAKKNAEYLESLFRRPGRNRKWLYNKAKEYVEKISFDRTKDFLDNAYSFTGDYREFIGYETAIILLDRITELKNSIEQRYRLYREERGTLRSFESVREIIKAAAEIDSYYNAFKGISKTSIEETLARKHRESVEKRLEEFDNVGKAELLEILLVIDKEAFLDTLRSDEVLKGFRELEFLKNIEKIVTESSSTVFSVLPKFVTDPADGNVVPVSSGMSYVKLRWAYLYPYGEKGTFTVRYGEEGDARFVERVFTFSSNSISIPVVPFKNYVWMIAITGQEFQKQRFSTVSKEVTAPAVEVDSERNPVKIFISPDPLIEGTRITYDYYVKKAGLPFTTSDIKRSAKNEIMIYLDEYERYELGVKISTVDGKEVTGDWVKKSVWVGISPRISKLDHNLFRFEWAKPFRKDVTKYRLKIKKANGELETYLTTKEFFEISLEPDTVYKWTVSLILDDGKELKCLDKNGQEIYWTLNTRVNSTPEVDLKFRRIWDETRGDSIFLLTLTATDIDDDEITLGLESSEDPEFTVITELASSTSTYSGRLERHLHLKPGEKRYLRAYADDGISPRTYSTTLFLQRHSWVAVEPAHKAIDVGLNPMLRWKLEDVPNAKGFILWISDPNAPESEPFEVEDNFYVLSSLKPHTEYSWHVTYKADGSTSPSWRFVTLNRNPSVYNLKPADKAIISPAETELSWEVKDLDEDTVTPVVEIVDADYNPVYKKVLDPDATNISLDGIPLKGNCRYYWRVSVTDGFGGKGISDWLEFVVKNTPPHLEIILPEKDSVVNPDEVAFACETKDVDDGRVALKLYINGKYLMTVNATSFVLSDAYEFIGHSKYELKVLAQDNHGGMVEKRVVFYTSNRNPEKPVVVYPVNGGSLSYVQGIKWSCVDEDGDVLSYKVIVKDAITEKALTFDTTMTRLVLKKELPGNKNYQLKIIAEDANGGKAESDEVVFYAPNHEPEIPVFELEPLPYPTLGASLTWKAMDYDHEPLSTILMFKLKQGEFSKFEDLEPEVAPTTSKQYKVLLPIRGWYDVILSVKDEKAETKKVATLFLDNRAPTIDEVEIVTSQLPLLEVNPNGYETVVTVKGSDLDGDDINFNIKLKDSFGNVLDPASIERSKVEQEVVATATFYGLRGHTKYEVAIDIVDVPYAAFKPKSDSYVERFETPNTPPNLTVIGPEDRIVDYKNVRFEWTGSDFEGDVLTYELHYRLVSEEATETISTDRGFVEIPSLKPHAKYVWQVVAWDGHRGSSRTERRTFWTKNYAPVVEIEKPTYYVDEIYPKISWTAIDPDGDSLTFEVKVFDSEGMLIFQATTDATFVQLTKNNTKFEMMGNREYTIEITAREGKEVPSHVTEPITKVLTFVTPNRKPLVSIKEIQDEYGSRVLDLTRVPKSGLGFFWEATDPDDDPLVYNVVLKEIKGADTTTVLEVGSYMKNYYQLPEDVKLNGHSTYVLIVEAADKYGGRTSDSLRFVTVNIAPKIVKILSPKNDQEVEAENVVFSWLAYDDDDDILTYYLYLKKKGEDYPTEPIIVKKNTSIELEKNLAGHTKYKWKLVAFDGRVYSDVVEAEFTTANHPPVFEGTENIFPKNNQENVPLSVMLSWEFSDVDGDPLVYEVRVNFGKATYSATTSNNYLLLTELPGNSTINWKVIAKDPYGGLTEMDQMSFVTRNHDPVAKLLLEPNAVVDPEKAIIYWKAFDMDGDSLKSIVEIKEINTTEKPFTAVYRTTDTKWRVEGLKGNRKYRIILKVMEAFKKGYDTDEVVITTANRPPLKPNALVPANGEIVPADSFEFSWKGEDPDGDSLVYSLVIENILVDQFLKVEKLISNKVEMKPLMPYSIYRWKVVAEDFHGGNTESDYWYFMTGPGERLDDGIRFTAFMIYRIFGEEVVVAGTVDGKIMVFKDKEPIGELEISSESVSKIYADDLGIIHCEDVSGNKYKIILTSESGEAEDSCRLKIEYFEENRNMFKYSHH